MLTHERLREVLSYDAATGEFRWLCSTSNRVKAGAVAGVLDKSNGYLRIQLDGRRYYAHRLAWFYETGTWPADEIDHRNRKRTTNAIGNLRPATHAENSRNLPLMRSNTSGVTGVYWYRQRSNWRALIECGGKLISLGYHTTKEAAITARKTAEVRYFGEFAPTKAA